MIGWPVFGIPVVLGWTGRYRRLQQFTLAFAIALVVTIIVSIFTPAMGTYDFLKFMPDPNVYIPGAYLEQLRDLPIARRMLPFLDAREVPVELVELATGQQRTRLFE